jgi:hypothetical protein
MLFSGGADTDKTGAGLGSLITYVMLLLYTILQKSQLLCSSFTIPAG